MRRAALEGWKSRDKCSAARDLVVELLDRRHGFTQGRSEDGGISGMVDARDTRRRQPGAGGGCYEGWRVPLESQDRVQPLSSKRLPLCYVIDSLNRHRTASELSRGRRCSKRTRQAAVAGAGCAGCVILAQMARLARLAG